MPMRFIEPCLPTISRTVPTGSEWAFEIKHDGFRFLRRSARHAHTRVLPRRPRLEQRNCQPSPTPSRRCQCARQCSTAKG